MQANNHLINSLRNFGLNPDEWIIKSINWESTIITLQKWEDCEVEIQAHLIQKISGYEIQNPMWII